MRLQAFQYSIDDFAARYKDQKIDVVAGMSSMSSPLNNQSQQMAAELQPCLFRQHILELQ